MQFLPIRAGTKAPAAAAAGCRPGATDLPEQRALRRTGSPILPVGRAAPRPHAAV